MRALAVGVKVEVCELLGGSLRLLWPGSIKGETATLWIVRSGTTGDAEMRFRKKNLALVPQYGPSPRWIRAAAGECK